LRRILLTNASGHRRTRSNLAGDFMEWNIIAVNFLYAALGVVLMFVAYRVIDRLTPEVNFADELRKGNIAVAIFIAAIFLAVAIIIGGSLN
jgi:putative membrane protein